MNVTPALKALMAEKAKAAAEEESARKTAQAPDWRTDHLMGLIDQSQDKLDANWNGEGWRPSALLRLRYCIAATRDQRISELRGEKIVMQALERAERSE